MFRLDPTLTALKDWTLLLTPCMLRLDPSLKSLLYGLDPTLAGFCLDWIQL